MGSRIRCVVAMAIATALAACNGGSSLSDSSLATGTSAKPVVQLQLNPSRVIRGNSATLAWSAENAQSCSAAGAWSGTKATSGSVTVEALSDTTTYSLTCTGPGGSESQSAEVVATDVLPSVTLNATPTTVLTGGTSVLTWSATNSTACTAGGGWSGSLPTSGTRTTQALTSSTEFTLTCTGSGGSAAQSTTISVAASAPAISLSASPSSLTAGESTTLTWSATASNSCTASGAWTGDKAATGKELTAALDATATFTLTCIGPGGSATQSAVVSVTPKTPTATISASPTTVAKGQAAVLTWSSAYATSCDAAGAWSGALALSGSRSTGDRLSSTATYTLICNGPGGTASQSTTVTVNSNPAAPALSLSAGPSEITSGEESSLHWTATNATGCVASGAWTGSQPVHGFYSTGALRRKETYTLTCSGPGGSATQSATVTVTAPQPTISVSAQPSSVTHGGSSTLTWTTTNATACTASGSWSGSKAVSGSASTGTLDADATYTLTCDGPGGTAIQSATVSVTGPAPAITLSANPTTVEDGSTSTLTWAASNSTTCTASGGWSGSEPTSGSHATVDLSATTQFTLTCEGPGGSASQSVTVTVAPPGPRVAITANPTTVATGGTSELHWSSSNATACSASGGWTGSRATSGSQQTATLAASTTYTLVCTGAGGSASASVAVTVTGTASLSWVAPTKNTNGTPVTPLAGYRIYYGTSANALTQSINVSGAATLTQEVTGLTSGTWYFAIAAVAADGTVSAPSAIGSKII